MTVSWFCFFRHDDPKRRLSTGERARLLELLRGCPGLIEGALHTSSTIEHPYGAESAAPVLALEFEFATATACEAALGGLGCLQRLAEPNFLPSLEGAERSQQTMSSLHFPVPEPAPSYADRLLITYLVEYIGPAEDERSWHRHFLESHVPIMQRLPGVRDVAVYTPAVVTSRLPFRSAAAMQRNKVVFDSADALGAALASPVRDELRADVATFPPYERGGSHLPMETFVVAGTVERPG